MSRHYSLKDNLCLGLDQVLRAVLDNPKTTGRMYPAKNEKDSSLTQEEKRHAAGLMRVNHAGEVAAQALYHAQGMASHSPALKEKMHQSAIEEGDHLAWCKERLIELGSHTSYLNPLWYGGAFLIGLTAGYIGDKWSLGFLAETENQVVHHLESHLRHLPAIDQKSIRILEEMQKDEAKHRDEALNEGAAILPAWIKKLMSLASKVMVKTAYWI